MVGPNQLVRRCSPLVVPVVRAEVAMVTVIFSSSFLSSPHFSLTEFSIARLQIPPFFLPLFPDLHCRNPPIAYSGFLASFSSRISVHLLHLPFLYPILSTFPVYFNLSIISFFLTFLSLHHPHCCFSVRAIVSRSYIYMPG